MAEVARFEDGGDADIVAEFLRANGIPAAAPLIDGGSIAGPYRGPIVRGRVMVADDDEAAALALFDQVRRGAFREDPRWAAINQLVLGGPTDESESEPRPRRLKSVVLIGYGLIGLLWTVFIVMTLVAPR